MAKKPDSEGVALEALAAALADPAPKVLLGTKSAPGFFTGSTQATKAAARLCEERNWLAATGAWVGSGKSKKAKYRLTPEGVRAVLEKSEPLAVAKSLAASLERQVDVFRALREDVGRLVEQMQPLAEVVGGLARRLEPPDLERIAKALGSPPAPSPRAVSDEGPGNWHEDLLRLVNEQRQRDRYQLLSLPKLYAEIRSLRPNLSLGQFHDGLRNLRDQRKIRLMPFTRALATIDDPRNAIFLDGEVMYYVDLP